MSPGPYDEYVTRARAQSKRDYQRWLLPLILLCAAIGGAIGFFAGDRRAAAIAIGVAAGAVAGALLHFAIRMTDASGDAARLYTQDWCTENGCRVIGQFSPANGPHAESGHRRRSSDAIEGNLNGLPTVIYNFSYWTRSTDSKGHSSESEHPYKILCIHGPPLPVPSMSFGERSAMNRLRLFDKLDAAFTNQRGVELESIEFNKRFDLEIHDKADDVWVRRVFDPATIDALVSGSLSVPDLRYYDQTFWLVENGHYKPRELDEMKAWQTRAAAAIRHLARIND